MGSIPSELLYREDLQLAAFGNNLTNLIPVEDRVICSDLWGEHYCDCKNQCIAYPGEENICGCEEAQTCCSSYLEQFDECILCETGLENPKRYSEVSGGTCSDFAMAIKYFIDLFDSAETCTRARSYGYSILGCRCKGGTPKCTFCESGIENPDLFVGDLTIPDLYVEESNFTCGDIQSFAVHDPVRFETESKCGIARMTFKEKGCRCKGFEEESVSEDGPAFEEGTELNENSECIICEFGLSNPDFFLEDSQMSCIDASIYIRENSMVYGTQSACERTRIGLTQAGCKCKNNLPGLGEGRGFEEYKECILCDLGLRNPDFFLDRFGGSCSDASRLLKENIEEYGTRSACDENRLVLVELGCECKTGESDFDGN